MTIGKWALLVLLLAGPAHADVLYNNFTAPVGGAELDRSTSLMFNSFSTGSSALTLSAVDLLLLANRPTDGQSFKVELYGDGGDVPGSLIATLGTFSDSLLTKTLKDFSVTLASTPALAANTRYWLRLDGGSLTDTLEWGYANNDSGTGVNGEFYRDSILGETGLNVWSNEDTVNGGLPYVMKITASAAAPGPAAVPEPASLAIVLAGLAAAAARRRRPAPLLASPKRTRD